MKKRALFKYLLCISAIFTVQLAAFRVVDVEIPIQMHKNDPQKKIFVLDLGDRNRVAKIGNLLAVLRKDEYGSLQAVGIVEITATANQYSKAKIKTVVENQSTQQFGIKGVAVGDSVFPLVMLPSKSLFGNNNSAILSKAGMELLADKIISYLHEGNFRNMLLFSYSNRKLDAAKESALAEAQAISIKKHLMAKHGIAEGMLKITIAGNNNPFNKFFSDSRQDFLFAFDPSFKEETKPIAEFISEQDTISKKVQQQTANPDTAKTKLIKPVEISSPGEIIFREIAPVGESEPEKTDIEPKSEPEIITLPKIKKEEIPDSEP